MKMALVANILRTSLYAQCAAVWMTDRPLFELGLLPEDESMMTVPEQTKGADPSNSKRIRPTEPWMWPPWGQLESRTISCFRGRSSSSSSSSPSDVDPSRFSAAPSTFSFVALALQSPSLSCLSAFLPLRLTSDLASSVTGRQPPKSVTLMCPVSVIRMFSGLQSPYTYPIPWTLSSAAATLPTTNLAESSSMLPFLLRSVWRSPPDAYSRTRYAPSLNLNDDTRRATPGWERVRRTAISLSTEASYPSSSILAVETTLTAYSGQLLRVKDRTIRRAYLTVPKAPAPSSRPKTRS
mmetsp:Transcript_5957/g.13655  ORF Transcript_5957/g.13655 Transcript_5957/m.13655 type:complete len:295 (-) Transcript_5957:168-1052(-)